MPIFDYFFNGRQQIEVLQQEFYATGIVADALAVHLEPGYTAQLQTLQIDPNSFAYARPCNLNNPHGWTQLDDQVVVFNELTPYNGAAPFSPFSGNQTEGIYWQFSLPTRNPAPVGPNINGEFDRRDFNFIGDEFPPGLSYRDGFSATVNGTYADQIWSVNSTLDVMSRLRDTYRVTTLPRSPGLFIDHGEIEGDYLVELPALFLARLNIVDIPPSGSFAEGSLRQLYHAGRVNWGHR